MHIKLNQRLEKLFYFIVLFLPIIFIFGSAILNISIVVLNIIFFVHIITCKNFDYFKENRIYFVFLLIFLIFQILNNILNENFDYFGKSIFYLRFLLLPLIFKYFSTFVQFDILRISKFYILILLLVIFDLFYQYIFDINLLGYKPGLFNQKENLYERYSGVFNDELIMGSYLSSFGFLIVAFYYLFNNKKNYIFLILLGILFLSVLLTGERSSLLNVLISIFFIFLFIKNLRMPLLLIGSIIVVIFTIGINSSDQLKLRYFDYPLNVLTNYTYNNDDQENKEYIFEKGYTNFINNTHWGMHYKTAARMFIEKPINGHGFKQFRIKCKNYSFLFDQELLNSAATQNGCSSHPHHYILEILSEQGLIGLIIFLFFIIHTIKDSFRLTNNRAYLLILFSIIIGYMLPLKPSGSIISTSYSFIFWIMLSFSYIKSKN